MNDALAWTILILLTGKNYFPVCFNTVSRSEMETDELSVVDLL